MFVYLTVCPCFLPLLLPCCLSILLSTSIYLFPVLLPVLPSYLTISLPICFPLFSVPTTTQGIHEAAGEAAANLTFEIHPRLFLHHTPSLGKAHPSVAFAVITESRRSADSSVFITIANPITSSPYFTPGRNERSRRPAGNSLTPSLARS